MKTRILFVVVLAACSHKAAEKSSSSGGGSSGTSSGGISAASTGGSSGSAPWNSGSGNFTTFQNATVVVGQADFASNAAPNPVSGATSDASLGAAAFAGQSLFLPDTYTHRVLVFSPPPTTNGATANALLGQSGSSTNAAGTTLASLYLPASTHSDGTTLAIADAGNNRVLLQPASASSASVIVGWPDASTPQRGCAADRLASPSAAFIGGGKLLVADRTNNRVLIWNSVPVNNGAAADLVLGQNALTSCVANDSLGNGTTNSVAASTLSGPTDVWTDGTTLLVADRGNNRVLVWSPFPTTNGAAANLAIGQTALTLARNDASNTVLQQPSAIAYAGGRLFVADAGHNRIMSWAALPAASGAAADLVLGQGDFAHVAANDDAQSGSAGTAPTARTLAFPSGVALAGNALVVSDTLNRRFLLYICQ